MGSVLGGSQSTSVTVPAWLEDAAQKNLKRADYIGQLGYTPYYGPDVAAMTPNQIAAMQNTAGAASAFGLQAPKDVTAGMPAATDYNGVQAYSSAPMYQQALDALKAAAPAQYGAMTDMFINPVTGEAAITPFGQRVPGGAGGNGGIGGGGGGGGWYSSTDPWQQGWSGGETGYSVGGYGGLLGGLDGSSASGGNSGGGFSFGGLLGGLFG